MGSSNQHFHLSFIITTFFLISQSPPLTQAIERGGGIRSLFGFKETPEGGNVTFDCSPSGPCVSCLYSEKNDEKYRCSKTGYRIPLKCVEIKGGSKKENGKKPQKNRSTLQSSFTLAKAHPMLRDGEELTASVKNRRLLDDSSSLEGGKQAYITYRSCIPAVFEEKLSVLGFEAIMLCLLLVSSPVVYFRRKRTVAMSGVGPVRIQTNSRF